MKPISASLIAIPLLAFPALVSANHVDFLVDGSFMITPPEFMTEDAIQTGDPGNIIGAEREVSVTNNVGSIVAELASVPSGPGPVGPDSASFLDFRAGDLDSLGSITLTYDGVGAAGLGGLDFDTNWNSISTLVNSVTGSFDFRTTVTDTSGGTGFTVRPIFGPGSYYAAFTDPAFSAVDFTLVDSVVLDFEATTLGTSFQIGSITREQAIPEPSASILAGLAAMALIARRRRTSHS